MCACAGEARAQGSIAEDRAALEAFYHALDGPWRGTENWASEAPLGEWGGVTTDESGRVTEVDLSVYEPETYAAFPRLRGPIPPELGNLTMLRKLDLGANRLRGPIPAVLDRLPNLGHLELERNQWSGPLPGDAARLANLELLHSGRGRLRDATEVGIERFAGEAGQLIAVSVRSQGFDARIKLLSPAGERLALAATDAGDGEFWLAWLPGNGEYRIEVAYPIVRAGLECGCRGVSSGPSPRCDYEVDVRVVPVEPLTLGTPVDPFLAAGRGARAWRFRGTAGQVVNVDARFPLLNLFTGFASLVLLSRAGEQLGWQSSNHYDSLRLTDAVLPRTEDYVFIYAYTHTGENRAVRLAVSASPPEPIR